MGNKSSIVESQNDAVIFSGDVNYDRLDNSAPCISSWGVSVDFLDIFVQRCGGHEALESLSVADVWELYIKPQTSNLMISYCDYLHQDGGDAYVGEASVLICHTWRYKFLDVVKAITNHLNDNRKVIIWFDLFSVNHHLQPLLPVDWLCGEYRSVMRRFNRVVLIMSPWQNPLPLRRAWCLWEIYSVLVDRGNSASFEVAMTAKGTKSFLKSILRSLRAVFAVIASSVDVSSAEASNIDHIRSILAAINREGDTSSFNKTIITILRDWLLSLALDLNASLSTLGTSPDGAAVLSPGEEKYKLPFDSITLEVLSILEDSFDYEKAVNLLADELEVRKKLFGPTHCRTLHIRFLRARCWVSTGEYDKAFNCLKELLTLYSLKQDKEVFVYDVMFQIAVIYSLQGHPENAVPLLHKVVKKRVAILKWHHALTLEAVDCLCICYETLNKWDAALKWRKHAINAFSREFGPRDIRVAEGQGRLARSLFKSSRVSSPPNVADSKEAIRLYESCIQTHKIFHGMLDTNTLSWMCECAVVLDRLGKEHEAEALYKSAWECSSELLGEQHVKTIEVYRALFAIQKQMNHSSQEDQVTQLSGYNFEKRELPVNDHSPPRAKEPLSVKYNTTAPKAEAKYEFEGVLVPNLVSLSQIPTILSALKVTLSEAEWIYRKVLKVKRNELSDTDPSTLASVHSLGVIVYAQNKLEEAEVLFREASDSRSQIFSSSHVSTLDSEFLLAEVLRDRSRFGEAIDIYRRVVKGRQNVLGSAHPSVVSSKQALAEVLIKEIDSLSPSTEALCESLKLMEDVLDDRINRLGRNHPFTMSCMDFIADVLELMDNVQESIEYRREVVHSRNKKLGHNHLSTLESMQKLALSLFRVSQVKVHDSKKIVVSSTETPEELLNEVIERRNHLLGEFHPSTQEAISCLNMLLMNQEK